MRSKEAFIRKLQRFTVKSLSGEVRKLKLKGRPHQPLTIFFIESQPRSQSFGESFSTAIFVEGFALKWKSVS